MLCEDRETETEFVTISYWESIEAITGGTNADPRQAHHLERDAEFLIELPRVVQMAILDKRGRIPLRKLVESTLLQCLRKDEGNY